MKWSIRKMFLFICIVLLLITIGFLRDYIFVNINAHIGYLKGQNGYYIHPNLTFLTNYSEIQLWYIKWGLTVLCALIYLLSSGILLKIIHPLIYRWKHLILTYLFLFIISAILYLFGDILYTSRDGYLLARKFMGLSQSPIPLMFFILGYHLSKEKN